MSSFGYDVLGFGANASGSGGDPVDDEFNRVSFLAHMEGANNGVNVSYEDSSASNRTVTESGNTPVQGSFGPFAREEGYWGVNFDGSTTGYISVPTDTDFDLTNATTLEFWVFIPEDQTDALVLGRHGKYWFGADYDAEGSANKFIWIISPDGSNFSNIESSANIVYNQWYFVQLIYSGTTATFYLDGVSQGTITSFTPQTGLSKPFYVGGYGDQLNSNSIVSNVRFSNVARSTSVPTAPFAIDSNTKLLLCSSNRFTDRSSQAAVVTPYAGAAVSAFGPFLTDEVYDPAVNGASAYFDGTNASLLINSPPSSFGTSNFTIEAWVNTGISTGGKQILGQGPGNSTTVSNVGISGDKLQLQVYTQSGGNVILLNGTAGEIPPNSWNHVALTHQYTNSSSSTYKMWINGVLTATFNHTGGYNWNTGAGSGNPIGINNYRYNSTIGGEEYLQDVRLVVGSLVYTSNFTPPTAPLTAITNTQLLLNMANGQAIDSAAQTNLSLIGGAKISTAQSKFGDSSMVFDGTGDRADLIDNGLYDMSYGSGDFTLEGWFRWTALPSSGSEKLYIDITDASNYWQLALYSGPVRLKFIANSTGIDQTESAISWAINTWYHIALVRIGSGYKVYVDGTAVMTFTSTHQIGNHTEKSIGGWSGSAGSSLTAYVDDFRISRMARYTGNFTAPTAPFADKGQ